VKSTIIRATAAGVVLYWPPRQRVLYSLAGPVSTGIPVVLDYTGPKRPVLHWASKLRRYGYAVRVRRQRRGLEPSPALPVPAKAPAIPPPCREPLF